jgi:hypothetical protein
MTEGTVSDIVSKDEVTFMKRVKVGVAIKGGL